EVLGSPDVSSVIFGFPIELSNNHNDDNFEGIHEWIASGSSFRGVNFIESFTQQQGEIERYISFKGDVSDSIKSLPIKVRSGLNTEIYQLNIPDIHEIIEDDLVAS